MKAAVRDDMVPHVLLCLLNVNLKAVSFVKATLTVTINFKRSRLLLFALFATVALLTASLRAEEKPSAKNDDADPFIVVLLPDTQFYSEKFPESYIAQTMWIRRRAAADRMKFAIHLGDIVQNADVEEEWKNAARAMEIIDGVLPYSMVPGNHDMSGSKGGLTRKTPLYNRYFPPSRYANRPWYGGHMGETNDNNYCYFEGGGMKFMVVSLEFAPRDEALAWAADVADKHPNRHVIVATHNYLRPDGRDTTAPKSYRIVGNSGEQMWRKLIRKHNNIFMVVSGHVLGVGLQTSINDNGGKVVEILTDYQGLKDGGTAWLRTLRFVPQERKIQVDVYSPLLK